VRRKHPWLIEFGNNLRDAREAKGISQEVLAELAGLDRTYVGGVERGERNISAINTIRLALALGINAATLFPSTEYLKRNGNL